MEIVDVPLIEQIRWAFLLLISLIICVSLHEFGHAWMADRCGDPLPRMQGRVTLDPRAHIDPLGTLAIPAIMIFGSVFFAGMPALIGWGKPVQISLPNAKTRKRDDIFTTLAGPGMNLLLAVAGTIALGVSARIFGTESNVVQFFILFMQMNIVLMIFNLLPLPPLDGSRVFFYAVKMREETFLKISRNAWWILLLALNLPSPGNSVVGWIFGPLLRAVSVPFFAIANFIVALGR